MALTREEMEAALQAQGSNYSVGDDYPDLFEAKPLAPTVENAAATVPAQTPVSYESRQPAPEPTMSAQPVAETPTPVEQPAPPQTAPVSPARKPRPKATAGAVHQAAPEAAANRPEPTPGQVTDADILGLDVNRKNPQAAAPVSSPEPSVANGPAPQADGVEDLSFDKSAKTRQIQGEVTEADNRALGLMDEKSDILDARQGQANAINAARGDQAVKSIEDAYGRKDAADARYEDSRAQQDAELKALKEKMGNPPFDTVGLVMGLVGALAAAHGKPEAGRMLQQGVGGAINGRMKRWQGEIEGGQQNLEGMGKLVNMDRLHAADQEQGAAAIQKAVTAEFDAALDQADREAKTEQEKNAISLMRNDFRQKLGQSELQRRQKAAEAARVRKVNMEIATAPTEERRKQLEEMYGDTGRQIGAANLKNTKLRADIGSELLGQQKTVAETGAIGAKAELDRTKAAQGPATTWAPKGWVAPPGVTDSILAKVSDTTKSYSNLSYVQKELLKIAEDVQVGKASWTDGNVKDRVDRLRVMAVPMGTQAAGAGAPNAGEFDRFMALSADPQSYFQRGDSYTKLKNQVVDTESGHARFMEDQGFTKQSKPGEARVTSGKRLMEFSDGTQAELSSAEINALTNQGSKLRALD